MAWVLRRRAFAQLAGDQIRAQWVALPGPGPDNDAPPPPGAAVKINAEQLSRELARPLASAWLVGGDEPLLAGESADAIRAKARAEGYSGRDLFFAERQFDWGGLLESSQSLSLFAERRIIEVKLPSSKPGAEGGKVLARLAADPPPDTIVLVVIGNIDRDVSSAAWFKAFEQKGVVVQAWPVEIGRLPQWIQARAKRHGLELDTEGARLLAERVEGNLLAAHQEIEKLALLSGPGAVTAEAVADVVANSARYDVFQLGEAALAGDAARSLRVLEGLKSEGTELPIVLWALCRDLRALAEARANPGASFGYGRQGERRTEVVRSAARRLQRLRMAPLVEQAGRIDRLVKGLAKGDPWTEIAALVATLAGAPALQAPRAGDLTRS